jgi:hypothetical protein
MWSALSRSELQCKIWEVIRSKSEQEHVTCRAHAVSLHQQMLLTLALAVQPTERPMPLTLTIALVDKQKRNSHVPNQCTHDFSHPGHPAVSLYEQKNTPYTGHHLHDWRDRLKSDIESQGYFQRDSIIRSVAQICQDLETRCNTVEEPLRREKELIIADERDSLVAKLKHLEAENSEAIRKADEVLVQFREDFNAKELEHRSTILIHEETTRTLEKEIEDQRITLKQLRDDLTQTEHERVVLGKHLKTLQQQLSDTESSLSDELHSVRILSEDIAQLKDRKTLKRTSTL